MLDPDLVIMDEFQRFNSLLEQSDDEQSMLANKFFDNKRSNTKILLLSATPYKPYSTLEELNTALSGLYESNGLSICHKR